MNTQAKMKYISVVQLTLLSIVIVALHVHWVGGSVLKDQSSRVFPVTDKETKDLRRQERRQSSKDLPIETGLTPQRQPTILRRTTGSVKMDGNTFVITNKKYNHANLAQWGTEGRDIGTSELNLYIDQFWRLEEDSNHKGYYYIDNVQNEDYRIAKWGSGDQECGIYHGHHYPDQMWRFVPQGDGYYRIYNYKYNDAKIAKWGRGDSDWGTYAGEDYDDQLWKLTPRYEAKMSEEILFESDNREGSNPFKKTRSVTVGLKLTSSSSLTTKVGIEVALKAAVSGAFASAEMSTRITNEITEYMSSSVEKSWSKTEVMEFVAPAGKNYRVKQTVFKFSSPLHQDNLDLRSKYTIEETDGEFTN